MAANAKPPVLATPAAPGIRSAGRLNNFSYSRSAEPYQEANSELVSRIGRQFSVEQDIASAVIAERYRLTPCMARLICQLASIGGRLA